MADAFDTIVIGAGPAGLSAAVFATRAGVKTLIIGVPEKSMLYDSTSLGNYLTADGMNGPEWLSRAVEQVQKYGATFLSDEVVDVREDKKGGFTVKTAEGKQYGTKTVVISTGNAYKKAGIQNEDKLTGNGVHYCVACDGYAYKGKKVAVIGNTSFAAEEAMELLALTKDITLISHGRKLDITPAFKQAIDKAGIKIIESRVASFKGEKKLEALVLKDGKEMAFDGAFVALGTAGALAFSDKLGLLTKKDASGSMVLEVTPEMETTEKNVFAAGACVGGNIQIAKSVGDGCNAAIAIIKRLKGVANYVDQT